MTGAPDLAATIWRTLHDATTRRSAFTLAWVATQHPDDGPQVRAMILRAVDPTAGTLAFATEAGSRKLDALARDPRVAVTVHDPDRAVQVRLTGHAEVAGDPDVRAAAWASLAEHTRASYGSPVAPGTPLSPGDPEPVPDEHGFDRFTWLRVHVDRIDHLDVGRDPQLRHVLRRATGWVAEPVQP